MYFNFLKYRKIYFIFSGILILVSLVCLITFGLKLGIDFVGGSLLEIDYSPEVSRPSSEAIREALKDLDLGDIVIQPTGERGVIIRMKTIDPEIRSLAIQKLEEKGALSVMRDDLIGPVIGRELRDKTSIMTISAVLAIIFYITLAFRKISRPLSSWQYGVTALIALFHDILITLGVFSILGFLFQVEVTVPIVTALLVILGYSINDTVVVFDRIRENLIKTPFQNLGKNYEEIVDKSLNQTLTRSINTSLTTLFVLIAIFFFGGETLRYFVLALIIGISVGVYSSIFLACPILVSWLKRSEKKKLKSGLTTSLKNG